MRARAERGDEGGALPAVLVLVVVVSALVAAVLLVYVAERRLVRRDLGRVQALYAAEAGLHHALLRFSSDPGYRAGGEPVRLPGVELPVRVWARAYGVYGEARALAATRALPAEPAHSTPVPSTPAAHPKAEWVGVRALVGAEGGPGYGYALVLADSTSALTLTGDARIVGDVLMGPLGARTGQLQGRGFRGDFQGRVVRAADRDPDARALPLLPPAVRSFAAETHRRYADAIERAAASGFAEGLAPCSEGALAEVSAPFLQAERAFRPGLALACASDGARLDADGIDGLLRSFSDASASDEGDTARPLLVLAEGALVLDGGGRAALFPEGTIIAAQGPLQVRGEVRTTGALLLGETVDVVGPAELGGQVLARRAARLTGGARVGPRGAVVVFGGQRAAGQAGLSLEATRVDGVAAYLPDDLETPRAPGADVVLSEEATVDGVLYVDGAAELAGRVRGSALVRALYFYASPAAYTNWLRSGVLVPRPDDEPLVLPLTFGGAGDARRAAPTLMRSMDEGLVALPPAPLDPD